MPVKKRRLSPSASSASSTPAPSSIPPESSTSALPSSSLAQEGLAGPGPSTLSNQYQSRRERNDAAERRDYARLGAQQPGSGDGDEYGEESFLWADIPVSKGFRYIPCAISPTPSPHPRYPFYRTIPYPPPLPPVHISWLDRSSYLRISPTALTISNDRGFRSARANVAVREGRWYYEVKIERGNGSLGGGKGHLMSSNPHVRIGWGRREANLDSPVGSDAYSYAIRDVNGEKVHISRPRPYAGKSFQTGDIIGCLITLPKRPPPPSGKNDPAKIKRLRRQFVYKNQSYFESNEYIPSKEMDSLIDREGKLSAEKKQELNGDAAHDGPGDGQMNGEINENGIIPKKGGGKKGAATKNTKKNKNEPNASLSEGVTNISRPLKRLDGSKIEFSLNGEHLGVAFQDLYDFIPLPPINTALSSGHGKKSHDNEITHDDGTLGYYPMISCFGKGKARFNPGPDFTYPPATHSQQDDKGEGDERIRPICERWEEFRLEEQKYDEQDEIEGTEVLQKLLEDEKKAALQSSNSTKRKKGQSGKKSKIVDITDRIRGRGDTMTPSLDIDSEGRDRSVSIAPSLINSVPPTRGSSPVSVTMENKIYKEIAEQEVVEDTPKSPAPLDNEVGNGVVEQTREEEEMEEVVKEDEHENGVKEEEDEEAGVKW
ncbi:hypothetical protein I203_104451 [Kwoniella mangroviensis CBS 8507]|uniref:uncharacterized protein n=1 Tax=Kwoniella mangroviensis CBS 8507 TaxID=1296122 RepID=UPI00080CFA90|nr:uncharacterized protein I203_00602 [Kwoniella mangroviensis CBS 8507]OCF70468.1 hypothetical protein I203_00602 [Kwoniella mangroviensis CBS 8507]